ncbi:MAG: DUF4294 domain-containing protein [Flavobacteriaceae bacterium]|jgi:hypothetical protein|nr:DUF4294 domain-containing protein [Candidatus Arcticimaribacter sp.]MDG1090494.1 DUF4294 domain-containing protein [Flavobacteriaceae bacterium]
MKKEGVFWVLLFIPIFVLAQKFDQDSLILVAGDSIPTYGIPLKEVVVFKPLRFKDREELNRYLILRRRVLRVYPYAKLAAERLTVLNERLDQIDTKRGKKKYMKRLEDFVYEEFEEELKKLSKSQGKILIRLVHRQTGSTTFELVKKLRNGWKAFIYQTTASLFSLSLKEKYNPSEVLEDYLIEDILQRAFADQYLIEQPPALTYDLNALYQNWKDKD